MKTKEQRAVRRARIRKNLKAFIAAVIAWFKKVEKKLEEVLPEIIDISLKVMTFIKTGTDSNFADMLTKWLPGDADSEFKDKISAALGKTIDAFIVGRKCLEKGTLDEKIACFWEYLKEHPEATQFGILQQFHARFVKEANPEPISLSEASYITSKYHLGQNLVGEESKTA